MVTAVIETMATLWHTARWPNESVHIGLAACRSVAVSPQLDSYYFR